MKIDVQAALGSGREDNALDQRSEKVGGFVFLRREPSCADRLRWGHGTSASNGICTVISDGAMTQAAVIRGVGRPRTWTDDQNLDLVEALFIFRGRSGSLCKILWHDGIGMSLYAKRLERGRFIWPSAKGGAVSISASAMSCLLEGIDWRNPQGTWRPRRVG